MNSFFCRMFVLFFLCLSSQAALASERVLSESELRALGLRPASREGRAVPANSQRPALPTDLEWPVTFEDRAHTVAQNFVQHQDYGTGQYYHGGCDLRAPAGGEVRAPVGGRLVGLYYGYRILPNGSSEKWERLWDGNPTPSLYFELAVLTDDGHRFELHHVDPMTLPDSIVAKLNGSGFRVAAGELLAYVARWPSDYDHVHYNIYTAAGATLNPETYSKSIPDSLAPTIRGVYAPNGNRRSVDVHEGGRLLTRTRELVVATTDTKDESVYVQMPVYFELSFASGERSIHDFRKSLQKADESFPDIRDVFVDRVVTAAGDRLENFGNYGEGLFLVRLPVPESARGEGQLRVVDQAGNESVRRFEYLPN